MLVVWNKLPEQKTAPDDLIVYCAAGIRKPVEEAVKAYQDEFGVKIALDYDSSGALEGKLQLDVDNNKSRADLYIPADLSFANRAMQKGLTKESIQLASFNLVLASNPSANLKFTTLDEFLDLDAPFVICNEAAGVGKTTKAVLENLGEWDTFNAAKKASSPRVTDAAAAIAASKVVQAGFLWNTTAKQFGLKIHEIAAFKLIRSKITANVCSSSLKARQALLFARYLAAPSKGQVYFAKHNFTGVDGDKWEENPELIVYCGGVNREAVTETLRDFEKREGCKIVEQFAGCGSLVANIKAIGNEQGKDCHARRLSHMRRFLHEQSRHSLSRCSGRFQHGHRNASSQRQSQESANPRRFGKGKLVYRYNGSKNLHLGRLELATPRKSRHSRKN